MKAEQDFKLVCTGGPYGDCCCSYAVELHGEWTVQEFVKAVLGSLQKPVRMGLFLHPKGRAKVVRGAGED